MTGSPSGKTFTPEEIQAEAARAIERIRNAAQHVERGGRAGTEGAWTAALPAVYSARDFLAVEREPLVFLIENILPKGGKVTISATSKFGKSMLAIQIGMALASGDCDFLGWRFGPGVRVLYLQAEIMDALLAQRIGAIINHAPPGIDRLRAAENFFIQEIANGRPNLLSPEGRATVESLIAEHFPDVLILDPLAALCPGLEENDASSLGPVLDYFAELGRVFGLAIILIHHHGKGGVSRGSSVFEAWPESDISATFADESRAVAKVELRLRCAYNPGPIFWNMPTPENLWFSVAEGYEPDRRGRGRGRKATPALVSTVLKAAGGPGLSHKCLIAEVADLAECSERTAKRAVADAMEKNLAVLANGVYLTPQGALGRGQK